MVSLPYSVRWGGRNLVWGQVIGFENAHCFSLNTEAKQHFARIFLPGVKSKSSVQLQPSNFPWVNLTLCIQPCLVGVLREPTGGKGVTNGLTPVLSQFNPTDFTRVVSSSGQL